MRKRTSLSLTGLLLGICCLLSFMVSPGFTNDAAAAGETSSYAVEKMTEKAVKFIHDKYQNGETLDAYTAYVLTLSGEDLDSEKWTRNGQTLKDEIQDLADMLGDQNCLIDYIINTQNSDGSYGPLANEYGTKAPLQALAMIKPDLEAGGDAYIRVEDSIGEAIDYFKLQYKNGSMPYVVGGWNFDYRCVEALVNAGEDISVGDWVYSGTSLQDAVISSADSTAGTVISDPSVVDAVYLAKELTVLNAVDPDSDNVEVLARAIVDKQNADGSFGKSIYDHVMVLSALGKSHQIDAVDQVKALDFINNLKQVHKDSWGQDAGAAWGSTYEGDFYEEPDLTAQVITALSYFDGAGTEGSEVYNTIQEGLAYLSDIQDPETAAIPAQWDSTFATAETLIALKSLGKTYSDYAGDGSPWVKKSKTKTIAQCLLALSEWNDTDRRDRLAGLLIGRQKTVDPGQGSFENSVYSDMWAFLALGEAGKIDKLNANNAREYILSKQHEDGSWGETFGSDYYPDFLSSAQAVRALTYLPGADNDNEIQTAIEQGLNYFQGLQKDDGGVYATPFDDPAVDNSEIIITLGKLGQDPGGAEWTRTVDTKKVNPVTYLMASTMNDDGSFGATKNVFAATQALYACVLQGDAGDIEDGSDNNNGNGPEEPSVESCSVSIKVIGESGEILYDGSVTLKLDDPWGITAMGALHATGLSYIESGGFVKSVSGQANSGMNGWMYNVNNTVPAVMASEKTVLEGDTITWWYSTDPDQIPGESSPVIPGETSMPVDEELFENLEETGEAWLDVSDKLDAKALLTLGAVSKLAQENNPLIIENSGIELEFASSSLITDEISELMDEEETSLEIQAREVDETERQEILTKAAMGESTGLFDIGGKIFELNAHLVRADDDETADKEKVESFKEPVKVTIDLSELNLSDEDIALLTAVRFEKDADGNITPEELGGTYDPETKTFTFYTDSFSYYGVCKSKERMIITLQIDELNTTVNGEVKRLDVPPTVYNNRTVVPLRFVSECLGADIEWIAETKTVEITSDDKQLSLVMGQTIPGFDTPAAIIDGRTFVPLRYVSESFGADVTWDAQSKKVEIVK